MGDNEGNGEKPPHDSLDFRKRLKSGTDKQGSDIQDVESRDRDVVMLRENEEGVYENEYDKAKLKDIWQNIGLRKHFSIAIFVMMCVWLIFTAGVLIASGISGNCFTIEPKVMMTLLGTSMGTVVGLFGLVARFLFSR